MTFPTAPAVNQVQVNYSYGFSGDMGGGPYNRSDAINALRTSITKRRSSKPFNGGSE